MPAEKTVARTGRTYEHFKGTRYKVIAIAVHSETLEHLVIYKGPDGIVWARPREMFEERGRFVLVPEE